jgi:hypothetical protein
MDLSDLNAYLQLIQDIIGGTVRRHTFSRVELDLLLDVQASHMRKAAKNELLRRYFRTIQQQFVSDGKVPLRFACFWQDEAQKEGVHESQRAHLLHVRTATSA